MPCEIEFADTAITHLAGLTARERPVAIDAIEKHLSREPLVETRNRKLLRPNPVASWELRVGALRVFSDVMAAGPATPSPLLVRVLAVGKKHRSVLRIGGEVIAL